MTTMSEIYKKVSVIKGQKKGPAEFFGIRRSTGQLLVDRFGMPRVFSDPSAAGEVIKKNWYNLQSDGCTIVKFIEMAGV